MQKIGSSTTSATAAGEYTEGNPGAGVSPTPLKAAWLNSIQRELVAVVEGAGLVLDPTRDDQLFSALQILGRQSASAYAADTGVANAYIVAYTPAITALTDGLTLKFKAKTANTGASTFSPNGLPAGPIVGGANSALQGGEIVPTGEVWVQWNSTIGTGSWVMIDSSGGSIQVVGGTKSQHAPTMAQLQSGAPSFALDTGVANTYVCAFLPAITARTEGLPIRFKAKTANTGPSTLNDGQGVVALVGGAHSALQGGEIAASGDCWVQWNTSIGGGAYILLFCTGAGEQVAPATQSQHAMQLGQAVGRLIGVQVFTASGIYTPTPGTTSVVVEAQGAGGGSGGVQTTASTQVTFSGNGGAGSYGRGRYTAAFSGVTVTVGAGGLAGLAAGGTAGGVGGVSSFGALLSAPGGTAGGAGAIISAASQYSISGGGMSSPPTGANLLSIQGAGSLGAFYGGANYGLGIQAPTPGYFGLGPGAGAPGKFSPISTAISAAGVVGINGIVIVYEYT